MFTFLKFEKSFDRARSVREARSPSLHPSYMERFHKFNGNCMLDCIAKIVVQKLWAMLKWRNILQTDEFSCRIKRFEG